MHIHTYTCPSNAKVGKCAGKSSVTRTSTRGNTLLPSTLTLLIGLRVTHSWGTSRARLDRKVPVTQTLSFCQMHFLSPLPVAFDRKLVSVIPVTVG